MSENEEKIFKAWNKESEVRRENLKKQAERDAKIQATLEYLSKTVKDFKISSQKTLENISKSALASKVGSRVTGFAKESFKDYGRDLRDRGTKTAGDITSAVLASLGPYGYLTEKIFGVGKATAGTLSKLLSGSKDNKEKDTESKDNSLDAVVQAIKGDEDRLKTQDRVFDKLELWLDYQEERDKDYHSFIQLMDELKAQDAEFEKWHRENEKKVEKENKKFRDLQNLKTGALIAGVTALTGVVIFGGYKLYEALKNIKIKWPWDKDKNEPDVEKEVPGAKGSIKIPGTNISLPVINPMKTLAKNPSFASGQVASGLFVPKTGTEKAHRARSKASWGQDIGMIGGGEFLRNKPAYCPMDEAEIKKITSAKQDSTNGNGVWFTGTLGDKVVTMSYIHLEAVAPGLKVGSIVHKGDILGWIGDTGAAQGVHLDTKANEGTVYEGNRKATALDLDTAKIFKNSQGNMVTHLEWMRDMYMTSDVLKDSYGRETLSTKATPLFPEKKKPKPKKPGLAAAVNVARFGSSFNNNATSEETTTGGAAPITGYMGELPEISKPKTSSMGKTNAKLQSDSVAYNATPSDRKQSDNSSQKVASTVIAQAPSNSNTEPTNIVFGVNEPLASLTRGNAEVLV